MNNDIKNAIDKGIKRGKRARRTNKIININVIVLVVIMVAFSISVNLSGALAASLKDVPVIGKFVDFIRIGSGYKDAAEHGFFSEGDTIHKDKDYSVSVEGYYLSPKNLNIVLMIDGKIQSDLLYSTGDFNVYDTNMNRIKGFSVSYGPFREVNGHLISDVVFTQHDTTFPDEIILKFNIYTDKIYNDGLPIEYNPEQPQMNFKALYEGLELTLTKQVEFENIDIPLNQSLEINGINLLFSNLIIRPSTMDLSFTVASDSMVFYKFKNIYIKSNDNVYSRISHGTTSTGSNENGYTYFFNTSFFHQDEPLTLVIEGIFALPIEQSTIIIDVETKEVLKNFDEKLVFNDIKYTDEYFDLSFTGYYSDQISFSSYNGNYFCELELSDHENYMEYIYTGEIKYLAESTVLEIDFSLYPNLVQCYEEILINK